MDSLIALMIITFLFVIGIQFQKSALQDMTCQLFFEAFQEKLLYAQHQSIVTHQDSIVTVNMKTHEVYTNLALDKSLKVPRVLSGMTHAYCFSKDTGTLKRYDTFTSYTETYTYILHVQFGRGVCYLEKIKRY
ncbi:hypothetical protein KG091_05560 [Carnobacteriaceae bacterium zg-ZUI78]|nr:hypothetical protein [Carnobacteriaceae bacterium zg-ZUI78]